VFGGIETIKESICTIQRMGVEGFVKVSGDLERLYFKGHMEIGKGPQLEK
jgi:hypothetical protein